VRRNIRLAEAPSFGQSIFQYAPGSNGAEDYRQLAEEVLAAAKPAEAARPG
jgi:chromosome partitioning protein